MITSWFIRQIDIVSKDFFERLKRLYKGRRYRTQAMHQYGADAYLEKPIDDDALLKIVESLLDKNRQSEAPAEAPLPASSPTAPGPTAAELEIVERLDEVLGGVFPVVATTPAAVEQPTDAPDIDRAVEALSPKPEPAPAPEPEQTVEEPDVAPPAATQAETRPASRSSLVWVIIGLIVIVGGAVTAYFVFFK